MDTATMTYKERMKALKCAVLIPTYNNSTTIAKVIEDVKEYADEIIVVNDGSTDNTSEILSTTKDIRVIEYTQNQGKGYALKLGFSFGVLLKYCKFPIMAFCKRLFLFKKK